MHQESSTTHPATDLTNAQQELAASSNGAALQDHITDDDNNGNDTASTSATLSHEATTDVKVQEIETTATKVSTALSASCASSLCLGRRHTTCTGVHYNGQTTLTM